MTISDLNPLLADPAALSRSTTLLRENGLRCLLLHLKAGEEIPEHRAPGAISVHCLQGQVLFSEGEATTELHPGLLLTVAPNAPHALQAREESVLLVTLAQPVP
jgi:quercetin dioxygenase-like cupin family protein